MNAFSMINEILEMHKEVEKRNRRSQMLYDELGGAIIYILEYAERNNIVLPNRQALIDMINRLHNSIDIVNDVPTQNEQPNRNNRRRNTTKVLVVLP